MDVGRILTLEALRKGVRYLMHRALFGNNGKSGAASHRARMLIRALLDMQALPEVVPDLEQIQREFRRIFWADNDN